MSSLSSRRSPSPTYNVNNPRSIDLLTNGASGATASFNVKGDSTVQVEIYGSATAGTASFFTIGRSGIERAVMGYKQADASTATTGINGDVMSFDVTYADKFVVRLAGVTGGTLSVNGRAV
jgi:hypothetical protein